MKTIISAKRTKARAFLSGIVTVLDIGVSLPLKPNIARNDMRANDMRALESDWKAVGKDLHVAIGRFENEQKMSKHLDK